MIFTIVFSKNLDEKITELEILNPKVGCCQGTFRGANLASQYNCSNLDFRDTTFFMIFLKFRYKKPNQILNSYPNSGLLSRYNQWFQSWRPKLTAHIFLLS